MITREELESISALRNISQECQNYLLELMIRRTYSPGEIIFMEGHPSRGIWFIIQGRVRIIKESLHGSRQGLCLTSAGKCFGGCPLFDGETTPATAQALDEVTLLILPREESLLLSSNNPCLARTLLSIFNQRLAHLAQLGEGLGSRSVSARIRECLLTYADETEDIPTVWLTHEDLATLVGTAREVVTRHLSRFEQDAMIRLEPGRITLLNMEALAASPMCSTQ